LDRLYSWLRFRSYGHATVRDIGDFVAHAGDRDRGMTWEGVSRIAAVLNYVIPLQLAEREGKFRNCTKEVLQAAMLANWEFDLPEDVKLKSGMAKQQAGRNLRSALKKVVGYDGEVWLFSSRLTKHEDHILRHYMTRQVLQPFITPEMVISQLASCLVKNRLLKSEDAARLEGQRDFICLYILEKMHFTKLDIGQGSTATLKAGISDRVYKRPPNNEPWQLVVHAHVSSTAFTDEAVCPLFATGLDPRKHCAAPLVPEAPMPVLWDLPLEIDQNGLLAQVI
jgi:hypothetical protein